MKFLCSTRSLGGIVAHLTAWSCWRALHLLHLRTSGGSARVCFLQVPFSLPLFPSKAFLGGAQPFGGAQWELPLILLAAYDADALPEQLAPKKAFPESSWKHLTVTESQHLKVNSLRTQNAEYGHGILPILSLKD